MSPVRFFEKTTLPGTNHRDFDHYYSPRFSYRTGGLNIQMNRICRPPDRIVAFGRETVTAGLSPAKVDASQIENWKALEKCSMNRPRFGEFLSRFVSLTPHDISEILEDQSSSRRRFGDIALAFGLCKPTMSGVPGGRSFPATGPRGPRQHRRRCPVPRHMPRVLAQEYNVIPIRASGSQMVIAAGEGNLMRAMEGLPAGRKFSLNLCWPTARKSAGQLRHIMPSRPGRNTPSRVHTEMRRFAVA